MQKQQKQQTPPLMVLSKDNGNNSTNDVSVDYADHFYDSTKIKIDDVPLLTDNFAPVENLLNPITRTPYNIEEKGEVPTNRKVDQYSIEGTALTFVFPTIIVGIWIFYTQRIIWKKPKD